MAKMKIYATLGGRIRAVRRAHGEAQLDLAEYLGISRAAISQWESNDTKPSGEKLTALLRHYGLQYDWLILGKGQPPALPKRNNLRRRLPVRQETPSPLRSHEKKMITDFRISMSRGMREEATVTIKIMHVDGSYCYGEAKPELARKFAETIVSLLGQHS